MLNSRAIVVITGGSRGIGREIGLQAAKNVAEGSLVILMARSEAGLNETKELIQSHSKVDVRTVVANLAETNSRVVDDVKQLVAERIESADLLLLVHNAGAVGAVEKRAEELNSESEWHEYLQSNLVSTILLNNAVYGLVKGREKVRFLVVDITSIAATTPFHSFTQYSVGKAAREAFFRSFALENPTARVLSYSPGPVDTSMRGDVISRTYSEELRRALGGDGGSQVNRQVLTTAETVGRLFEILEASEFKSGSRIDYFDHTD